jgi:hypothetical protein
MIPMRAFLMASAALLSVSTIGMAVAQDAPAAQPPAATNAPPTGSDPSAMPAQPANPGMGTPGTPGSPAMPSPPADPNAGQPTGAVPPETGMVPAPADAPRDPAAPVGSANNPVTVGGNMTPPPTETKDYPVCSRTVQDSCINPGEARKARARR